VSNNVLIKVTLSCQKHCMAPYNIKQNKKNCQ